MISFEIFKRFFFSTRAGALIKRLSWLSMIQIALSLMAFVIVMSVMGGMNQTIAKRINSIDPDLIVEVPEIKNLDTLKIQPVIARLQDSGALVDFIESSDIILRTADGFYKGLSARGLSDKALKEMAISLNKLDEEQKVNSLELVSQWNPEEIPGAQEVVLGFDTAQFLNVFEGDWLTVIPPEALLLPQGEIPTLERVRVKKIVSFRLQHMDSQLIWYQRGLALQRLVNSPSRRIQATVKLKDANLASEEKQALSQFVGVKISTWQERNSALFTALKVEKFCIGAILFLAGLISSFSVVMALSLLITQKQKDWSLMKALGFSQNSLEKLVLKLGLWLSGGSVLVGVIVGTGVSLLLEYFPPSLLPSIYYDSQIPAQVDVGLIFLVVVFAMGICYWACANTVRSMKTLKLN
jgi:lipoprotein-releasing system permease protein